MGSKIDFTESCFSEGSYESIKLPLSKPSCLKTESLITVASGHQIQVHYITQCNFGETNKIPKIQFFAFNVFFYVCLAIPKWTECVSFIFDAKK